MVLFNKKVMYSAFSFLLCLLGVASLYVLLLADFVAVAQIVVYIGGILVLLIFGLMFTTKSGEVDFSSQMKNRFLATVLGISFFAIFTHLISNANIEQVKWIREAKVSADKIGETTIQPIGVLLMSDYILAFEVSAIILLIALIGATFIAGKKVSD
ncbi:MAG: NADH-quinone oxidoreductase subunit J [Flammeovirgaceae bacterium]